MLSLRPCLLVSAISLQLLFWLVIKHVDFNQRQRHKIWLTKPPACQGNASLGGAVCTVGGLAYRCAPVPGKSVDTPLVAAPSKLCLNGSESWGRCAGGEFLCQVGIRKVQDRCAQLVKAASQVRKPNTNEWEWMDLECDLFAGGVLSPLSMYRLSLLGEGENRTNSRVHRATKIHIVSVYSEPPNAYNQFWMCAATAARLAHGYAFHEIIVQQFTFSEKPRQLLSFLSIADLEPQSVIWFQDAFDVVMLAGETWAGPALDSMHLGEEDVLFNGECNCFPKDPALCQKQKQLFALKGPHHFLNSGQFLGRASTVERLLRGLMHMIDEAGGDWPSTDQGAFAEFCFGSTRHRASKARVRCVVDAGAVVMRTMIRCEDDKAWSEPSIPLDIPLDLGACQLSAVQGRQGCLIDPVTKNQAASLHFNGKGPNHDLEIQKLKPFVSLALERSSFEGSNLVKCSYVYMSNVFMGCVDYMRRCSGVVSREFVRSPSGRVDDAISVIDTVCVSSGLAYSCLQPTVHPQTNYLWAKVSTANWMHRTPSLCSGGAELYPIRSAATTSKFVQHADGACARHGMQYRCVSKHQTDRMQMDCLSSFASSICETGAVLCQVCGVGPLVPFTVKQAMRVWGCQPEKYIGEARKMLLSRFDEVGNHGIQAPLLTNYLSASPSRAYMVRLTLVSGQLFVTNLEHVADTPRAKRVIDEVLQVIAVADVPDFDLIFHIGDGAPDAWPLEQPHVQQQMFVPVFVHDMWHGAGAILAPPRSHREVNLASISSAASSIVWSEKRPRAVWRGSTTGDAYTERNWREMPRSKAVLLSRKRPDLLDAGFTHLRAQADDAAVRDMQQANMSMGYLDYDQIFEYQALLSIDGNSVADRLPALMVGSAVIKQDSDRIEFWYHDLKPFVHYIPVKHDMSNLEEVLDLALKNVTLIMQIARNSRELVLERLHPHCILCYWIQLLHMYSRFMSGSIKPPAKSMPMDACRLHKVL